MRRPGGRVGAEGLREAGTARVQRGEEDPRAAPDYVQRDAEGKQIGPSGFFSQGFFSAINWEQVARLEQLWARNAALRATGPIALQNARSGRPQSISWTWPRAACKKHVPLTPYPTRPSSLITSFPPGQGPGPVSHPPLPTDLPSSTTTLRRALPDTNTKPMDQ